MLRMRGWLGNGKLLNVQLVKTWVTISNHAEVKVEDHILFQKSKTKEREKLLKNMLVHLLVQDQKKSKVCFR